ncbi:hypothetical protein [Methylobacterium fujisawaense]|uniref:hypothetical protein n=1 Tax=Methylobacterium fujisawaense TaxID=107400 RepID=UPI00244BA9CF|nr:hypothetical protein [Methylobacterium fujisawaense]MDH3031065.1 hypothetical protein [Methylobacterium fujisawaense]
MNVTLVILGRTTDATYAKLATTTVVVGDAPLPCTPVIPPAAAGQDLALRITPDDNVCIAIGQWLDPATRPSPTQIKDAQGNVIGTDPAPVPFTRGEYVAWGGATRWFPFNAGKSIVLRRPGVGAAA